VDEDLLAAAGGAFSKDETDIKRQTASGSQGISNPHFKPSVRLALTTCMLELARIMSEVKLHEGLLSAEQYEMFTKAVIATAEALGIISGLEADILRSQAKEAKIQAGAALAGGIAGAAFGLCGLKGKGMALSAMGSGASSIAQGIGGLMAAEQKLEQAELTEIKGGAEQRKHLQENLAKAIERFQQNMDEARKSYDSDLNALFDAIRQAIQANLAAHSGKG
jgi:hypothetical protein